VETVEYHEHLAAYLKRQRWFAGKGRSFAVTHIHALPWMSEYDPAVRIEVVTVEYEDGSHDVYQFPTAYLPVPDPDMGHALVAEIAAHEPERGRVVYDAVHLKPATDLLLNGFLDRQESDDITFHVLEGADLPGRGTPGAVMTGEQSNTSVAYGDDAILKLFRRISPGGNPDIEIHEALTLYGRDHVAPLLGWVAGRWTDAFGVTQEGHLGMLQVFLRTGTDGWALALASVRDLLVEEDLHPDDVGGDFAGEAERLGEATGEVHLDLARLFETALLSYHKLADLATAMNSRLDAAMRVVPELAPYAEALRAKFHAITDVKDEVIVQRVHGDFHLGQTLRTVKGWKILDFEGEPAKSLSDRVSLDSPLRDVAGMLRSFEYAAGSTLASFGNRQHLAYRAQEWSQRNRKAFLSGYAATTGQDLDGQKLLLDAYEADKAVYEAVYEVRNRPGWLDIPLRAIERLAAEADRS
jgi:maltokinase